MTVETPQCSTNAATLSNARVGLEIMWSRLIAITD